MAVQTMQRSQSKKIGRASRTKALRRRQETEAATEADSVVAASAVADTARPASTATVESHAQLLRQTSGDNPAARVRTRAAAAKSVWKPLCTARFDLARKEESDGEVAPEIEESIQQAKGGGQPLDQSVRGQMESTFGGSLDHVRVHTDAQSDTLNRALSARAFTVGSDIFFRQGAYNPGASSGRELIAHETTHVVQQGNGQVRTKLAVNKPGDKYEQEADAVAKSVTQAEQLTTPTADAQGIATRQVVEDEEETAQAQLQRQPEEERKGTAATPTPTGGRRGDGATAASASTGGGRIEKKQEYERLNRNSSVSQEGGRTRRGATTRTPATASPGRGRGRQDSAGAGIPASTGGRGRGENGATAARTFSPIRKKRKQRSHSFRAKAASYLPRTSLRSGSPDALVIWETNRGKDNPAPNGKTNQALEQNTSPWCSGMPAMATIEQATMPYAIIKC